MKFYPDELGEWVCDNCYNKMEVTKSGNNIWFVRCPYCENSYYVDNDGEIIND